MSHKQKDKKRISARDFGRRLEEDIEFEIAVKMPPVTEKLDPGQLPLNAPLVAVSEARVSAKRAKELIEGFFEDMVALGCEKMELEALCEMHAEAAMERAIKLAVENGWSEGSSTVTLARIIDKKIREMASSKIANEYRVKVDVTLEKLDE